MTRFNRLLPITLVVLLIASVGLAGCSSESKAGAATHSFTMASMADMPTEVQQAPIAVQQAYQFAVANPEALKHIPCYCGCNSLGHMNNTDCYVKTFNPDGTVAEFENHAAY